MARGLSERPDRMDPSTGLTRPGQTENQNPASMYQPPAEGVQAPTPRLGRGAYAAGYGEPGGPMAQQYGRPNVPAQGLALPPMDVDRLSTSMTGELMPSGNNPVSGFEPRQGASAAENRSQITDAVRAVVRRNGGRPADLG